MKTKAFKRMSALALSALMLAGTMTFTPQDVKAGAGLGYWPEPLSIPNYWYYTNETLQPYGTCLQVGELRNWSPDNDPDARYNRGAIPLRDRWMGPNVNPLASRDAKVMPLAMSNARASEAPSQGADGEFVYAFNNFQYVDTYNFWGGSSAEGPIAIPSPEHIDSAHRNGVAATGTIFIPWGDGAYGNQFVTELVEKLPDGSYPCADKLIEIAQYYGFDGYIFNAESGTGVAGFKDFLVYMQQKAPENFRVSWYNGSGTLNEGSIKSWMQDGDTRVNDEWWLDMSGSGNVDGTIDAAYNTNRSKWDIHSTWEYIPMEPGAKGGNYQARLDENGKLKISLGILAPTTTLTQSSSADDFMNVQDQELWVGPTFDPSSTYRPSNEFCGFANLVADQTPIIGTDFVTHFNPGNGYKFFENGEVVGKENGWHNRSLTEVLPTWRWIVEAEEGASKLNPKIDYEDAFFGGASMKVSGNLTANKANHIKLYSTKLDIKSNTKLSLTYKTPKDSDVKVSVGLCYGEDYSAENFKFYPVSVKGNNGWNEATVNLGEDAGKQAIAISLKFESANGVEDYTMNIGKLAVTTNETAPEAPSKATIDEVIYPTDKEAELRMYWEKGENSFIDLIYRVKPDGEKEFVGATPSDAFYVSKFKKLADETSATFEIVSFSENGVKGGSTTLEVKWPQEIKDGYQERPELGENLALKKPAVTDVTVAADGPVDKINDGVIPNSKWCGLTTNGSAYIDLGAEYDISRWVVYHANARGAGEGVSFNTIDFELLYAGDDGKPIVDPGNYSDQQRIKSLNYTEADRVRGNKANVTDRNISAPVKARYIKLHVTTSDATAWKAIRIYELELYSEPGTIPVTAPQTPLERNISIKNNAGATDTIVFDNVAMQFSSGSLTGGNGVVDPQTGIINLYTSMDAEEPFASVRAEQTTTLQRQNYIGTATFNDLDLNADGGRLWYTVQDASGGEVVESPRYSIEYAPESGEAVTNEKAELTRTTKGVNLTNAYGKLTVSNLPEGAYVKVYPTEDATLQILTSNKADKDGVVTLERIPLDLTAGNVYYEVHMSGKADSQRHEIAYTTDDLKGDVATIDELIKWYSTFDESAYIPSTWGEFETAREALNSLSADSKATEVDKARKAIKTAEEKLLKRADAQRYKEVYAEWEATYTESKYTQASFAKYKEQLDKMKALIEKVSTDGTSERELEDCRVQVEKAIMTLEPAGTSEVTGVKVTPNKVALKPGETQEFTAEVLGNGDFSQEVTWKLEGQTSENTTLENGLLTVGEDEPLNAKLTVTATSVEDETKSATATVTVGEEAVPSDDNVALNAEVVGYSGNNLGSSAGPEKLFDGKAENTDTDKWCVDGKNHWVAFDIGEAQDVVKMVMKHAEFAGEGPSGKINTSAYNFKVLNTEKISEEDFLSKTAEERKAICEDNSYWKEVVSVSNNKKPVTEDVITLDAPARIFKLQVTKTDTTGWGECVRIYELELYANEQPPVEDVKVSIEPQELVVTSVPGQKGQFTAVVTGTDNVDVTWTISGNTDENTLIGNGQLFLGADETASKMTVTATSVADETKSATATVIVEQKVDIKATENGTITSDDDDGYVKAGTTVTLTVTPNEGYKVAENGVTVNTVEKAPVEVTKVDDTTYTFVMPEKPVDVDAKFVEIVDKSALEAKLAEAEAITNNNYTDTSWTNLQSEIGKAREILANDKATQKDVDLAIKGLDDAIKGLKQKASKEALGAFIDFVSGLDLTEYTEESVANLDKVLKEARAVFNDSSLTIDDQATVDKALEDLKTAYNELEVIAKLDKSALEAVIKEAEGLDLSKYTEESVANFNKVLEEAKTIMADDTLTGKDQATVDNAVKALKEAIKSLEVKPGVLDKSKLENLVKEVEKIDLSKYTDNSVANFNEVLKEAKAMLEDQSLTDKDQAKVDEMVTKLQKAKDSLVLKDQTTNPDNKPNNKPDNKPGNNKPGTSTPATGDTAPIFVTVGLLVVAFVSGIFFFWRKKKTK